MSRKIVLVSTLLLLLCLLLAVLNFTSISNIFAQSTNFGNFKNDLNKAEDNNISKDSKDLALVSKDNLIIVGDVMLARDVERRMLALGNDYPYHQINFSNNNSYVLANFEASIPSEHQPTPNNTFKFSVNSVFLKNFREAGFTHLSLANNHSFDHGLPGYNNTVTTLWDNNFVPFGHPTVLSTSSITFLSVDNKVISLIAIHTLFNNPDPIQLKQIIDYASLNSDIQIAYIHWGNEYSLVHSIEQRKLAKELSSYGTDLIVGHHPHVVQDIELIDKTIVFYSLGNYIFDQYFSDSVQNGLVLDINLEDSLSIKLLPVTSIDSKNQPKYMSELEKNKFLLDIASRSSNDLTEQIKSGLIIFDITLATSSEVAIMAE